MSATFARRSPVLVLTTLTLLAAVTLGAWWLAGRPVDLPEVTNAQLQCASYAPYRLDGESPFIPTMHVDEARIREDLTIIAERTHCVRTYSTDQGLDAVPKVAASLGMKVLVGAWLGRNRQDNEREIKRAVELAKEHPESVRGLVVGNEVLLRRELSEQDLATYLQRARAAAAPVPVTYADVWEFWLEHPRLADSVSFVTIHILPYWEDEPVGIDAAIQHVVDISRRMRDAVGGKSILIGETGWPSAGRQRRDAVPGQIEQARFLRQFAQTAESENLQYNVIEAFDQPWKRRMEGAMGGYWGLFDSAGQAKFGWTGPVSEVSRWGDGIRAGLLTALVLALVMVPLRHRSYGVGVGVLAGLSIGGAALAQWRYMLHWNRDAIEWLAVGGFTIAALAMSAFAAERLAARRVETIAPIGQLLARASGQRIPWYTRALGVLRFIVLFGAACMTVLLVFDPRYRGFPVALYAIPTALWLVAWLIGERVSPQRHEESLLALIIVCGGIFVVINEGLSNIQALRFELIMLLLAGCASNFRYGFDLLLRRQAASSPSSRPIADGS